MKRIDSKISIKKMLKAQVKKFKKDIKHLHSQKLHLVQQTSKELQNLRTTVKLLSQQKK